MQVKAYFFYFTFKKKIVQPFCIAAEKVFVVKMWGKLLGLLGFVSWYSVPGVLNPGVFIYS